MYLSEGLRITPEVRVVQFHHAAVRVFDDPLHFGRSEYRSVELKAPERRYPDGGDLFRHRFNGDFYTIVPDSLQQHMTRGEVSLIRSSFFCPPRVSQGVGQFAEVLRGRLAWRAGIEETEYLRGAVREEIHDDRMVGEVESGILDIQRLNEARSHVELVEKLLAAVDGTVFAPAHIMLCAAREASVVISIMCRMRAYQFIHFSLWPRTPNDQNQRYEPQGKPWTL